MYFSLLCNEIINKVKKKRTPDINVSSTKFHRNDSMWTWHPKCEYIFAELENRKYR